MKKEEWFENWFNTKWYHILYGNRDYSEASDFIETIVSYLNPPKKSTVIDAACGSGRHSIHLSKLGFDVLGFDLSPESIKTAKQSEHETLKFSVADLRYFVSPKKVDYVFNLFTSFGYFQTIEDNLLVLESFSNSLKRDGKILIDFFNSEVVVKNLVQEETKNIDSIDFYINRALKNQKIVKKIKFRAEEKEQEFTEVVSAFRLSDFKDMLTKTGFRITHTFGDYSLNNFQPESSPRLLIIAEKC